MPWIPGNMWKYEFSAPLCCTFDFLIFWFVEIFIHKQHDQSIVNCKLRLACCWFHLKVVVWNDDSKGYFAPIKRYLESLVHNYYYFQLPYAQMHKPWIIWTSVNYIDTPTRQMAHYMIWMHLYFKMHKVISVKITLLLEHKPLSVTQWGNPIQTCLQMLIFERYLACAAFHYEIHDVCGVSELQNYSFQTKRCNYFLNSSLYMLVWKNSAVRFCLMTLRIVWACPNMS